MNKSVLVTGAGGFIGSHLIELLVESGYNVKALCQYNSFNNWGWLDEIILSDKIEIVTGDVTDPFFCQELLKDVSVVFNLAALIAVPYSYKMPASYLETNINGALNICNAALHNGNIRVIQTSTSEVYGTAQYIPIDEKHPKVPQSPYAASKIGADAVALSYFYSYDLPVSIARPFNTYGPRQSARAVIPSVITQIVSGKKKIRLGNIDTIRDFNFVTDVCKGLISIAENDKTIGKEINICSNSDISIEGLIKLIKNILNSDAVVEIDNQLLRPEKSEVLRLNGDNALIMKMTGWKPSISLTDGLRITCEWFSKPENLAKYKTEIYNF